MNSEELKAKDMHIRLQQLARMIVKRYIHHTCMPRRGLRTHPQAIILIKSSHPSSATKQIIAAIESSVPNPCLHCWVRALHGDVDWDSIQ